MRIAQIITTLGVGGAEKQLLLLCRGLKREGHEVAVGCIKKTGPLAEAFLREAIPVRFFGQLFAADMRTLFSTRNWLRELEPDVVHTHLFKADFYGGLAAYALGIPWISSRRNDDPYLRNPLYALLVRLLVKRCGRLITISEALRRRCAGLAGISESAITVIPIGIDRPATVQRNRTESVRIGIVGRLVEQKGHLFLIEAVLRARNRVPGIRLIVFGSGPLEAELKNVVWKLHLDDCVEFRGLVLDQEKIYSAMDILVLPSLWEGAGNVLLEAMSYGIPIVASDTGGIPEYVTPECALLVPVGDVEALSTAILRIAQDEKLRSDMAEAGPKRAHLFDFENTLQAHIDIYRDVVTARP